MRQDHSHSLFSLTLWLVLYRYRITLKVVCRRRKDIGKYNRSVRCLLSYKTCTWCPRRLSTTRQLTTSINKCCVLNVGKTNVVYWYWYWFCSRLLQCRDLGVTVTSDLSMSNHISVIVAKAHQRANVILRCFVSRHRNLPVCGLCGLVSVHFTNFLQLVSFDTYQRTSLQAFKTAQFN